MKYYSLKNKLHKVNFKEALFNGLAPDRGLYFPKEVTELNNSFISGLRKYDKSEVSLNVISQFIGNEIDKNSLRYKIEKQLADISKKKKIPLLGICHGLQFINFWRGDL